MIVIISGSPRKEKSCCREYAEIIALATGDEYKIYEAGTWNIDYCNACEECMKEGRCVLDSGDDFDGIMEDVRKADALIFASPVYCGAVSAQMKTFFDRMVIELHVMSLLGKPSIALAVSEGTFHQETVEKITEILEYSGASVIASLAISNKMSKSDRIEKLKKAGDALKIAMEPGYELKLSDRTREFFTRQNVCYRQLISFAEFLPNSVGEAKRWEAQGYMNRSIDDIISKK